MVAQAGLLRCRQLARHLGRRRRWRAQWLTGGVESVFAHTLTAAPSIETEDVAVAALKFKCGAVGTLTATTAAFPGLPARIDIYGTEGSAIIEGDRLKQMVLKDGRTYSSEEAAADAISVARGGTASVRDEAGRRALFGDKKPGWGDAHRAQILDLIRAIREDTEPLMDGLAARQPVAIVLAAYASSRAQRPIRVEDLGAPPVHFPKKHAGAERQGATRPKRRPGFRVQVPPRGRTPAPI